MTIEELGKAARDARAKAEEAHKAVEKKQKEYDRDWGDYEKIRNHPDSPKTQKLMDDLKNDSQDINNLLDEWDRLATAAREAERAYYDAVIKDLLTKKP